MSELFELPDLDIFPDIEKETVNYNFVSSDKAREKAERENLNLILPTENQLFVDIDSNEAFKIYEKNIELFNQFYSTVGKVLAPSKSGGEKKHITITMGGEVSNLERLLLQAFLGSDLKREFLGLQLIRQGDKTPTLFLEKKNQEENQNGVSV